MAFLHGDVSELFCLFVTVQVQRAGTEGVVSLEIDGGWIRSRYDGSGIENVQLIK